MKHKELKFYLLLEKKKLKFSDDIDFKEMAKWTEHFTGADLQALLYNAHLESVHSVLDTSLKRDESNKEDFIRFSTFTLTKEAKTKQLTQVHLSNKVKNMQSNLKNDSFDKSGKQYERTSLIITLSNMHKALSAMGASVSVTERKRYALIYSDFIQSRGGDFTKSLHNLDKKQTLA